LGDRASLDLFTQYIKLEAYLFKKFLPPLYRRRHLRALVLPGPARHGKLYIFTIMSYYLFGWRKKLLTASFSHRSFSINLKLPRYFFMNTFKFPANLLFALNLFIIKIKLLFAFDLYLYQSFYLLTRFRARILINYNYLFEKFSEVVKANSIFSGTGLFFANRALNLDGKNKLSLLRRFIRFL